MSPIIHFSFYSSSFFSFHFALETAAETKPNIKNAAGVTQKSWFLKKQDFVESPPHSLLDI